MMDPDTARSPLSAIGAWARGKYESSSAREIIADIRYAYRMDPSGTALRCAFGGAFAATGLAIYVGIGMAVEHDRRVFFQDYPVVMAQQSHVAFARGLTEGFEMSGITVDSGTIELIQALPFQDFSGQEMTPRRRAEQKHLHSLHQAGISAAESGSFSLDNLHIYAEFIQSMPENVQALRDRVAETVSGISSDPEATRVASLIVSAGLLASHDEIGGRDFSQVVSIIGSRISDGENQEISTVLMQSLREAARLQETEITGALNGSTVSRGIAEIMTRDLDRFLTQRPSIDQVHVDLISSENVGCDRVSPC